MLKESEVNLPAGSLVISEIAQQPALWPTTLERVLSARVSGNFEKLSVLLTGAGTSAYAALAIADSWPGARAIPTTDLLLQSAAEIEVAVPGFSTGGVLISLARSGDSPESVAVVKRIKKFFPAVRHLVIVCNAEGRLARMPGVQVICLDPRTNDRSLAMTSSFSNLVLAGLCLIHNQLIAEHLPAICGLVAGRLAEMNAAAKQIANSCGDRIVVLTSSMHALAEEGSLKVVELTAGRVTAMPQTFLGLRHGPVTFVRQDSAVVCFASSNAEKRRYEEDLVKELKERGLGRLVVIGNETISGWEHDWFIPANAFSLPDFLRTPFEAPIVQLLAYHFSLKAKVNPDDPSPNGAVTRVVTQFRIHKDTAGA